MKLNNRKSYLSPIAEIVIIDGNDDLLDADIQTQSKQQGGEEADAKPATPFELRNEIWDE